MSNTVKKTLTWSVSLLAFVVVMSLAALSMSNYLVGASFYGEGADRPDTREELCAYVTAKLEDPTISKVYRHRYEKDQEMHCSEDQLHAAAEATPVVDTSLFRSFLHQASSGAQALTQTSNYFELLDAIKNAANATSTTESTTQSVTTESSSSTTTQTTTQDTAPAPADDDGNPFN